MYLKVKITVAHKDKTLPRIQTLSRIQKHIPESKKISQNPKQVPESKTRPRIWILESVFFSGRFFRDCIFVDTHLPRCEAIAYVLPLFDALTHVVIHVSWAFIIAICLRKAFISICVCQGFVESSKAFTLD